MLWVLMSTHNIGFYEDLTKLIFHLSSNIIKYAPYLFCFKDDPRKTRSGSMSRHTRESVTGVGDMERTSSNEDLLKNLGPLPVCM